MSATLTLLSMFDRIPSSAKQRIDAEVANVELETMIGKACTPVDSQEEKDNVFRTARRLARRLKETPVDSGVSQPG